MRKSMLLVISVVVATILACSFSASTANIEDAKMAKDSDGKQSTTVFAQDETFYAVVEVANAPDDTKVKAVWVAVEADGVDPDFVIGEKELEGGGTLTFSVSNKEEQLWPAGKYKVDLFLNGDLDRSLEFRVEGQAVAEEPTDTPEPEPTDTPEPEPTDTSTPEPEDDSDGDSSTGDTLAQPTKEPAEEAEALPLQDEYYVHPSGAFGFRFPVGWEIDSEKDNSVTVGSDDPMAKFSVMYTDAGHKLSEAEMEELSEKTVDAFTAAAGGEYEVLQTEQDEDGVYVQVQFKLAGFDVVSDFLFVQQDTVVYILNFIAADREAMQPTLEAILDTYDTDPAAAKAGGGAPAAKESEATPVPPPPTATPATSSLAPPPGVARVYLQNLAGGEYYIDFGDGSGQIKVDPGAQNLFHDVPPGRLTPSISLFGGATANADFEIGPDQAWVILLDSNGATIRWGQVYP